MKNVVIIRVFAEDTEELGFSLVFLQLYVRLIRVRQNHLGCLSLFTTDGACKYGLLLVGFYERRPLIRNENPANILRQAIEGRPVGDMQVILFVFVELAHVHLMNENRMFITLIYCYLLLLSLVVFVKLSYRSN